MFGVFFMIIEDQSEGVYYQCMTVLLVIKKITDTYFQDIHSRQE